VGALMPAWSKESRVRNTVKRVERLRTSLTEHRKSLILIYLEKHKLLTSADVAKQLEVGRTMATTLLGHLEAEGRIREHDRVGRGPIIWELDPRHHKTRN
jgi:predicted ArsR family transcriptional regulator